MSSNEVISGAEKNASAGLILYVTLNESGDADEFRTNPTLAAGDVTISLDGGAFGNLATLPAVTPAGGKAVKVTLSQGETNADVAIIIFEDQTGTEEWESHRITVYTRAITIDDSTSGLAKIATDVAAILVDTGTTLDDHCTDIKGTAFSKDTHSLTNIEGYADLIDDGTSGLAKIATDVAAALVDTNALNDTKITTARANKLDNLDAAVSTVDTVVDAIKVVTDKMVFSTANQLDSRVESWKGTTVTVSSTTSLPEVDAKSVSDNAAAADAVQANIANLDAAITTRTKPADSQVIDLTTDISSADTEQTVGGALKVSEAAERYRIFTSGGVRTLTDADGTSPLVNRTETSTSLTPT